MAETRLGIYKLVTKSSLSTHKTVLFAKNIEFQGDIVITEQRSQFVSLAHDWQEEVSKKSLHLFFTDRLNAFSSGFLESQQFLTPDS